MKITEVPGHVVSGMREYRANWRILIALNSARRIAALDFIHGAYNIHYGGGVLTARGPNCNVMIGVVAICPAVALVYVGSLYSDYPGDGEGANCAHGNWWKAK
jgi:hypothetical protein